MLTLLKANLPAPIAILIPAVRRHMVDGLAGSLAACAEALVAAIVGIEVRHRLIRRLRNSRPPATDLRGDPVPVTVMLPIRTKSGAIQNLDAVVESIADLLLLGGGSTQRRSWGVAVDETIEVDDHLEVFVVVGSDDLGALWARLKAIRARLDQRALFVVAGGQQVILVE